MYQTDNVIRLIHQAHKAMLLWGLIILAMIAAVYLFEGYIIAYEGILLVSALCAIVVYYSWWRNQRKGLRQDLLDYYSAIQVPKDEIDKLEENLAHQSAWNTDRIIQIDNFLIYGSKDSIRESLVYLPLVRAVFVERKKSRRFANYNVLKFTYSDDIKLQSVKFAVRVKNGREKDRWNELVEMISLKNPQAVWY